MSGYVKSGYGAVELLKAYDITLDALGTSIKGQDITILQKLTGAQNSAATLASALVISGAGGAYALDDLDMDGYTEAWYLIEASVGNTVTGEVLGTGDGTTTSFSGNFTKYPVRTNSITIHYTIGATAYTATDDGSGNISGTDCSGTIDYATGAYSLTFTTAPDSGTNITADYTSYGSFTISAEVSPDKSSYYDVPFSKNKEVPYVISATFTDGDSNLLVIVPALDRYQRLVFTPDGVNDITATVKVVRRVV